MNFKIGPVFLQYIIVIVANFTMLHLGLGVAWLSPVMVKLRDENQTVLPEPLTENEMAWILSIGSLVALTAFSFTSYLTDRLGRRSTIIIACIPRLTSCLLFVFTSRVWMLLLGRALCGFSDYITISVSAMYSAEIAGKEIRGGLGTLSQFLSCLGFMIMLSIGPFVSYNTISIMLSSMIFITFIPIVFLPESPYFLYSQGKVEEAGKLLTYLRGSESSAREELKEYSLNTTTAVNKKALIKDVVFLKTMGKVIFLAISSQMIGYNAVIFYLQTIFESTNTSVRPEISSVVIGCIQLLACSCTMVLTDRCGRKPVLVVSLVVMAVGMAGLGTFFEVQADSIEVSGWLNYLPLVSLLIVIFGYNTGTGAIVWTLVAELFDGPTRGLGVSLAVFIAILFTFLTTRYFQSVANALGPAVTYWVFSICCVATFLFVSVFIPETKGKAFSEIQKNMGRKDIATENQDPEDSLPKIEILEH